MNVKGKKSDLQLDSTWILIKLYCILKVRLPWWLSSKKKKNLPAMQEMGVRSLGQGRSPGEGIGNPCHYS